MGWACENEKRIVWLVWVWHVPILSFKGMTQKSLIIPIKAKYFAITGAHGMKMACKSHILLIVAFVSAHDLKKACKWGLFTYENFQKTQLLVNLITHTSFREMKLLDATVYCVFLTLYVSSTIYIRFDFIVINGQSDLNHSNGELPVNPPNLSGTGVVKRSWLLSRFHLNLQK